MLFNADAIADVQRSMACVDCRAAVALALGIVPIRLITILLQVELSLLHLGFLKAEKVCVKFLEVSLKPLALYVALVVGLRLDASAQAIDIP